MSLPELRCLLCDRALLDETTALPSERCQQCGKLMKLEEPVVASIVPPGEQAGFTPGEGSLLTTFDELPEAVPVVQPRTAPPISEVPTVQPRAAPPVVLAAPKPRWVPPIQSHPPVPPHEDQIERPKPKFGCAMLVVLGFMLMGVLAVTFIIYAIARGLRKAPKTESTPTKLVTEATARPTPDKPKPRDPELIPVPVSTLWVPPRGTFPLGTATAAATADAPLPGASTHGVLAGNGRFILFPAPSAQMIAVFDVSSAKVIGYLPMTDRDSLVAGTANHAVVLSPAGQSIGRFDLSTLKHERTELFGDKYGKPLALASGHSARGPIYLLAAKKREPQLHLLNPETLLATEWTPEPGPGKKPNGVFSGSLPADRAYLRASASGRILVGGVAVGQQNYRADRSELFGANPVLGPTAISIDRPAFPTADGGLTAFDIDPKTTRFPVAEGNGFFEIVDKGGSKVLAMTFIGEGHVQRAEVKGIADFADDNGPDQDRRAFYIPSAQAFVHLSADRKTIRWRRVKLSEELPKLTQDYFVISSTPPATAVRGETFEYEPRILGNSGEPLLRLDVQPPGMTIEGKKIVWNVPASAPEGDVVIEFAVESKLKPKVAAKQRFTVQVAATAPPAARSLFAPNGIADLAVRHEKAGKPDDPLKFTAEPERTAKRGQTYRAKLPLSTPEDVAVHIRAAPVGVLWSGSDLVWNVPADAPLESAPVVVTAQTASGKQISLGYLLDVQE